MHSRKEDEEYDEDKEDQKRAKKGDYGAEMRIMRYPTGTFPVFR